MTRDQFADFVARAIEHAVDHPDDIEGLKPRTIRVRTQHSGGQTCSATRLRCNYVDPTDGQAYRIDLTFERKPL